MSYEQDRTCGVVILTYNTWGPDMLVYYSFTDHNYDIHWQDSSWLVNNHSHKCLSWHNNYYIKNNYSCGLNVAGIPWVQILPNNPGPSSQLLCAKPVLYDSRQYRALNCARAMRLLEVLTAMLKVRLPDCPIATLIMIVIIIILMILVQKSQPLWEENLFIKDKTCGPKLSFRERFHCIMEHHMNSC